MSILYFKCIIRENTGKSLVCRPTLYIQGGPKKKAPLICFRASTLKLITLGAICFGFSESKLENTAEYLELLVKKIFFQNFEK